MGGAPLKRACLSVTAPYTSFVPEVFRWGGGNVGLLRKSANLQKRDGLVAKKGGRYAGSTAIDVAALRRRQELEDAELQADMVRHEKQIKIMRENPNAIKRSRRPSVHRQSQVIEFEGTEVSEL